MASNEPLPEGVFSLLDTDLYKLTMQSAVLKYFSEVDVTYSFTNRTADMRLNRAAYNWLKAQINKLANISVSKEEIQFLHNQCSYLSDQYLSYLKTFRMKPAEQVEPSFHVENDTGSDDDLGDVNLLVKGKWVETILYEIPLLALTSEAYFKFIDRDWRYDGQVEKAHQKGVRLLQAGCMFSEFGTRRRRDYHTQKLVIEGLTQAQAEGTKSHWAGKLTGTSNVHFAMKFGISPIGTVAHEWFMGIAALTGNYEGATELALKAWVGAFGEGVLGIALTDTFGTPSFLKSFKGIVPSFVNSEMVTGTSILDEPVLDDTSSAQNAREPVRQRRTFAQVFTGVRQDSGSPLEYVKTLQEFYKDAGISEKKSIVFSDSLNVERCIEYKKAAEEAGFLPSFGVGTYFTNDFTRASNGEKSPPMNIVIKISSANGNPAIKISDNAGKNTGDAATVADVKARLGYTENKWKDGDEKHRWNV